MRWTDLDPEPDFLAALDHAGARPDGGNQNQKRDWSDRFADGCAVAIAREVRRYRGLPKRKRVLPESLGTGTEPLTPLGATTKKRIDVTVVDPILGLELGFSLKGLNFRDEGNGNFDKNLTGRLYELADEARVVHEHLPHAFLVGVFFLPIDSALDKTKGQTSFAHTVAKLRERSGRLDTALAGQAPRCDSAWVALYTLGSEAQGFKKGVARFFDVSNAPPQRGRPAVEQTLSVSEMVSRVFAVATRTTAVRYSDPETPGPGDPALNRAAEPDADPYNLGDDEEADGGLDTSP
jgi:hypothetical protein